jgi:iron complex outermembrane receptor protein
MPIVPQLHRGITLRAATRVSLCLALVGFSSLRAQQSTKEDEEVVKLEAFVVDSYADSLKKSMLAKRAATEVRDVILSEDIGEFPDSNVAEALQRITGVQIQRTDGEGSYVSVRGVEPGLNLVTIDGRTASSGGFERAFDFSTLSSDVVSSLEVIKSQSADLVEGGVGAIIAIKTPKPLNFKEDQVARASIGTSYLSMTEEFSPKYSGLFSQKFMDGKMGALVSFSYEDKDQRTDKIGNNGWVRNAVANGPDKFTPRFLKIQSLVSQQERIVLNGAFQFEPSDALLITLSATANEYTTSQANNAFNISHPGAKAAGCVFNENNTAVSYTGAPSQAVPIQTYLSRVATNNSVGTDIKWQPNDKLRIDLGLAYSESETDSNPEDLVALRVAFLTPLSALTTTYPLNDGGAPDIAIPGFDFQDQTQYGYRQINLGRSINQDDELAANIDIDYKVDEGFFTKFEGGVRFADRNISRPTSVGAALLPPPASNIVPASVLTAFPANNFLDASNADLIRSWMVVDQDLSKAFLAGNGFAFNDSTALVSNPLALFDITETVSAAYAKVNFASFLGKMPVHGNIGVRYARTELNSSGGQSVDGQFEPVSVDRTYDDFLPSFTLVAEPSENVVLRFAASKVMTRPNLSFMAVSRTGDFSRIPISINDGNPYLDPYRATQLDLSLEWYLDESSLFSLAVFHKDVESFVTRVSTSTPFVEELAPGNNIPVGEEVALNQPENLAGDTVKGFEVSFQKSFSNLPPPFDGLGVNVNYTFTKSGEATRNGIFVDADERLADGTYPDDAFVQLPLEGLSQNSYNLGVFYQKGRFSIRAGYNWRERYLLQSIGPPALG